MHCFQVIAEPVEKWKNVNGFNCFVSTVIYAEHTVIIEEDTGQLYVFMTVSLKN